jgi:hypothetical protein
MLAERFRHPVNVYQDVHENDRSTMGFFHFTV